MFLVSSFSSCGSEFQTVGPVTEKLGSETSRHINVFIYSVLITKVRCVCSSNASRTTATQVSAVEVSFSAIKFLYSTDTDTLLTRNSSGDEIANVNYLCNDIVHALKIQ